MHSATCSLLALFKRRARIVLLGPLLPRAHVPLNLHMSLMGYAHYHPYHNARCASDSRSNRNTGNNGRRL